jgi:hypothetical protein
VNETADPARRLSSLDTAAVEESKHHACARWANGPGLWVSLGMHAVRPRSEG